MKIIIKSAKGKVVCEVCRVISHKPNGIEESLYHVCERCTKSLENKWLANNQNKRPMLQEVDASNKKTLAIFDFDDTLFKSAEVSERWKATHPKKHPMMDASSIPDVPTASDWISQTVAQARKMCSDPNTLCVMMTGRTKEVFDDKLDKILKDVGLSFAATFYRPLAEKKIDIFKKKHIYDLIKNAPALEQIIMWDDNTKLLDSYKREFEDKVRITTVPVTY